MISEQYENYNNNLKEVKKDTKADIGANNCPHCGSENYIPILYGYPTHEAFEKADRGELILAGCCIYESNPPNKKCKNCGTSYR